MDLNGAGGLWDAKGADLYGVVKVGHHPAQAVHLREQVNLGHAVVL